MESLHWSITVPLVEVPATSPSNDPSIYLQVRASGLPGLALCWRPTTNICHFRLTRDQDDLKDEDSSCSLLSVVSSVLLSLNSQFPQDLCLFITPPQDTAKGAKMSALRLWKQCSSPIFRFLTRLHLWTDLPGVKTAVISGTSSSCATPETLPSFLQVILC